MKICYPRFNIILLVLCCLALVGCKTTKSEEKKAEAKKVADAKKKYKKERVMLQFYLAGMPVSGGRNISLRDGAIHLSVEAQPFLDFRNIVDAQLVEDQLGYAIQVQFDNRGAFALDTVTTAHRGRNIAVSATRPEEQPKWIAAPIIHRGNSSGYLTFTPDMSREEAERIVHGIRNVVKEMNRP